LFENALSYEQNSLIFASALDSKRIFPEGKINMVKWQQLKKNGNPS